MGFRPLKRFIVKVLYAAIYAAAIRGVRMYAQPASDPLTGGAD